MTPEELNALIAGNVRAARARLQLRQEDVADEIGWTRPTVSAIEAGRRRITMADAVQLCTVLRIELRDLLQGAPAATLDALGLR